MGGVGKSQLAAHYARTAMGNGELDVLVWVTAGSTAAVVAGFAQAGVEVLGADPSDPEGAALAFLAWLEPKPARQHGNQCRWLVVLDDVADPADLRGWWPPANPHGRTVVTTRRKDSALIGGGRRLIEVDLFTPAQSLTYLTNALAAHDRTEPDEQLAALAATLGHLPLALSQAASYLVDTGLDTAAYRAMLADHTRALADAAPDVLPDGQTHAAAAAWDISIDHANALRPRGLARPLLQLAAFLAPSGIPQGVLTSPPALTHLSTHGEQSGGEVTIEQAVLAIRALHRLGLIQHSPETPHQAVRVHQLVQRAVRDTLTTEQHHHIARTAADAVLDAWPDAGIDQAWFANTTALADVARDALYRPDVHEVVTHAGRSLGRGSEITVAREHFLHLTTITAEYLGRDHPRALTVQRYLARSQSFVGDAAGAAAELAEVLDQAVKLLGPDHPDAYAARNDYAFLRVTAGDLRGAVSTLSEVVESAVRIFGPDHAQTLSARNNLAWGRGESGDTTTAVAEFDQLVIDMARALGSDHAHTLIARANLAWWEGETGDATSAVVALTELVDGLGPDHPNTLPTRALLARAQGRAGDAAGAAATYAEILKDELRIHGPDHPITQSTRRNLAHWQAQAGDAT
ncbi:tetratricopeptide repeat protein [Streptomyces millisiae]|uniref:Tetratricopeptide repeat protein n=1 Tax=Streptomyces millisiae TaxID=3075542 RepID=A0ABU2LV16_9ACTN|nr:tetratricopeptide repeat protein [Streptomyces sp. DSM 44918]MDT0321442.1 tetratricopeptide repeat protein [Streptomyces sp. DSM 44918]